MGNSIQTGRFHIEGLILVLYNWKTWFCPSIWITPASFYETTHISGLLFHSFDAKIEDAIKWSPSLITFTSRTPLQYPDHCYYTANIEIIECNCTIALVPFSIVVKPVVIEPLLIKPVLVKPYLSNLLVSTLYSLSQFEIISNIISFISNRMKNNYCSVPSASHNLRPA